MFTLNEDTYVLAYWNVVYLDRSGEMFCMISRDDKKKEEERTWDIMLRFRRYVDDRVFDSEDQKTFYTAEVPVGKKSELQIMAAVAELVLNYPLGDRDTIKFVKVQRKGSDAVDVITKDPSFHIKRVTPENDPEYFPN